MALDKQKSPSYKDVSLHTQICHLPRLINDNNRHTKELFENICVYTDSSQYIKIPLITKTLVKGGTGDFNNIIVRDKITLSENSKLKDFTGIVTDHSLSLPSSRFSVIAKDAINIVDNSVYTHDSYSIYHGGNFNNAIGVADLKNTVGYKLEELIKNFHAFTNGEYYTKDEIDYKISQKVGNEEFKIVVNNIDSSLNDLNSSINSVKDEMYSHLENIYNKLDINKDFSDDEINEETPTPVMFRMMRSVASQEVANNVENENIVLSETNNEFVEVYNSVPTYYTYPINLYTEVPKYSDKHYKSKADYNDVKNGIRFKYYNSNNSKYLKIDNELPVTIHGNLGDEIDLIIEKKINKDINIKLSSSKNSYSYVRVESNDIDLARITLVCVDYNDVYGSTWYVKNYSGNIHLK